jgi:hypothetical protein
VCRDARTNKRRGLNIFVVDDSGINTTECHIRSDLTCVVVLFDVDCVRSLLTLEIARCETGVTAVTGVVVEPNFELSSVNVTVRVSAGDALPNERTRATHGWIVRRVERERESERERERERERKRERERERIERAQVTYGWSVRRIA